MLSLSELDLGKKCDAPAPLELLGVDGKPLGITIQVLGAHAETVTGFIRQEINAKRIKASAMTRSTTQHTSIQDDIAFGIRSVAVRIAGWNGISEDYTPENAVVLCEINPDIRRQVLEFSEDLANFTKG